MDRKTAYLHKQGVNLDIIAVAGDIAKACPEWSDFLLRLQKRAREMNAEANSIIDNEKE